MTAPFDYKMLKQARNRALTQPKDVEDAKDAMFLRQASITRLLDRLYDVKRDFSSILDIGSFNFGPHIFVNTPDNVIEMAKKIAATGVKPELEVFDLGGLSQAKALIKQNLVKKPYLFQICLGIPWAAEANPETMMTMRNQLPENVIWSSFGISKDQLPMVAQSVILGGHVRVGLEDNLYISRGKLAAGNAALVERAVNIITNMGYSVANTSEAREILNI